MIPRRQRSCRLCHGGEWPRFLYCDDCWRAIQFSAIVTATALAVASLLIDLWRFS